MTKSFGLYLHVPFCVHKCGYCDFNSWAEQRREPQLHWLEALERQLTYWAERVPVDTQVGTLFFGGGTPSLLDNDLLLKSCELVREKFTLRENYEWTIECNPETLNEEKLNALKQSGANRLSVGIQSFNDEFLTRLERRARRKDNLNALELIAKSWPGAWSMDLIFALPGQSLEQWLEDLDLALSFAPRHLSAYQLTLGTERSKKWEQGDDGNLLHFYTLTEERLLEADLNKYEISNFSKAGFESLHNLNYWRLNPFLGVGPGASGLVPSAFVQGSGAFGFHQKNPDRFETWCEGAGTTLEQRWLEARNAKVHVEELFMMGLRLREGIREERLGPWAEALRGPLTTMQSLGFIKNSDGAWRATGRGEAVLDSVLIQLFKLIENIELRTLDFNPFEPKFTQDVTN